MKRSLCVGMILVAALGWAQEFPSAVGALRAVEVAGPFSYPWAVAWLSDGTPVVTERDGRLNLVRNGQLLKVSGVPKVTTGGQGGLFDVLVLPGDKNELLISYASEEAAGKTLRVSKATLAGSDASGWRLEGLKTLFDLLPRSAGPIQYGGRLALLPDGTLLIAAGDRGQLERAQVTNDGAGKIHRIRLDGSVPGDNPFVGKSGWQPTIWTLGHRNIQGLWVDKTTGAVWATEHGPMGGDEVNPIVAGRNYGWPTITYGVNYGSGTKIGEGFAKAGMEQPVLYWKPSIAPSGLTRYDGNRYPGWKGSFVSGALAGKGISRFIIAPTGAAKAKPDRATVPAGAPQVLIEEEYLPSGTLGRIRDVRTGPDGFLYLTTDDSQGKLYRLEPAN